MLYNQKVDALMQSIMDEAESGPSIYTDEQVSEIAAIMYLGVSQGEFFNRIYKTRLADKYPLPKGMGLVQSHIHLRNIYNEVTAMYKKHVKADKEILFDNILNRLETLYWESEDDREERRKVLAEMRGLLRHTLSEKALENANNNNDEGVEYHLDFNL